MLGLDKGFGVASSLDLPSLWNRLLYFQLNMMRLVLNRIKKLLDVSRISFYFYFTIGNYIILIQNKHIGYILWSDASYNALFCCASGPSESQLQTMWWRAEFLSVNWVVCLSHWIHPPGKRSCCCTKTGKRRCVFTLNSWLFFLPTLCFLTIFVSPSLGAREVEAALDRMIDRCQSGAQGSARVSVEDLVSVLGLTDRRAAVTICGLYSKVEAVLYIFVCRLTA